MRPKDKNVIANDESSMIWVYNLRPAFPYIWGHYTLQSCVFWSVFHLLSDLTMYFKLKVLLNNLS